MPIEPERTDLLRAADDSGDELSSLRRQVEAGRLSAPMGLMRMLIAAEDVDVVARAVAAHAQLTALLQTHRAGCARICAMLRSGVDSPEPARSVADGLAFARNLFDWSVQESEEASVALYSLGSPELLAAATAEVVALLDGWGLLRPHHRCLQIGCGIGRFEAAIGPRVAEARGIDLSERMVERARQRCRQVAHTAFEVTEGRDLAQFPARRFELVYAVDTFPYLVQAGLELAETHIAEAARVLVDGGALALLNFSYRDDLARDRDDVARMARAHGLEVEVAGAQPLTLWDGAAWRLRKPERG